VMNTKGILMEIASSIYVAFCNIAMFVLLVLLVYGHRKSFHCVISFSVSFFNG
jgi:hypothetical protein